MFIVNCLLRVIRSAVKIAASLIIVMITSLVAAAAGRLFLWRRSSVEQQVWNLIMDQLGVEKVSNYNSLIEDLGADSLDTVEVVMALEEEFGLEIPDEDAEKYICGGNVGDLIKYVQQHID